MSYAEYANNLGISHQQILVFSTMQNKSSIQCLLLVRFSFDLHFNLRTILFFHRNLGLFVADLLWESVTFQADQCFCYIIQLKSRYNVADFICNVCISALLIARCLQRLYISQTMNQHLSDKQPEKGEEKSSIELICVFHTCVKLQQKMYCPLWGI